MSTTRPIRQVGAAGIALALIAGSAAATAGLGLSPNHALADEAAIHEQAAQDEPLPVYPPERDDWEYCVTMGVPGTYDTTGAQALLDRINEIRAEAAAEGIAVDGVPVSGKPLQWTQDLEFAAQVRAVEATYLPYHWRTVGIAGAFYRPNNTFAADILDENIAWSSDTAAALEGWYAEKDAYLAYLQTGIDTGDFGRYLTLISDAFSYVGIGSFAIDPALGVTSRGDDPAQTTVVALFADTPTDVGAPARGDGPCIQQINVAVEYFKAEIWGESNVGCATSSQLTPVVWMRQTIMDGEGVPCENVAGGLWLSWKSSNECVARVDQDGVVYGVAPGTATITLSCQGIRLAYFQVEVAEVAHVSNPAAVFTDSGTAPVLPVTATATLANGETIELPVTWGPLSDEQLSILASREGGSFVVAGTVEGWGEPVSCAVEVAPAEPLSCAELPGQLTEVGVAPVLPASVDVTWSNGDVTSEPLSWDGPSPEQLATADTVTISGAVGSTGLTASVSLEVKEPTVSSVEGPAPVAADSGSDVELPAEALCSMSNGTTESRPVAWEPLTDAQLAALSSREGGSFEVAGAVEGWGEPVSCTVEVAPAKPLSCADLSGALTEVGVAPELPASVDVTWSNGDVTSEPVSWDGPTSEQLASAGTVELSGAVGSTGLTVSVSLEVKDPTVSSVEGPATVAADSGSDVELPAEALCSMSNGTTESRAITWEPLSDSQAAVLASREGGSFEVTGTVEGWSQSISCTVEVAPAEPLSCADLPGQLTEVGVTPELPASVDVTWSNGDVTSEPVSWDGPTSEQLASAGTVEIAGSVGSTGLNTTVAVEVKEPTVSSVENPEPAVADSGSDIELPAEASCFMSNGTTESRAIAWEPLSDEQAAVLASREGGSFVVVGAVEGWSQSISCTVEVAPAKPLSCAELSGALTEVGVAPELPASVDVTWSNGDVTSEPVSWDGPASDQLTAAGTVEITGTAGSTGLAVSVPLEVKKPTVSSVEGPAPVAADSGSDVELPAEALCSMSNDTTESRPVAWEPLTDAQLAILASREGGAFEAVGSVEGWGEPVSCTVEVAPAEPLSCADLPGQLTEVGVAPELPAEVEVSWSNGDVTSEQISWDGPAAEQLAVAGAVEISGAVGTTGLTASVSLEVKEPTVSSVEGPAPVAADSGSDLDLPADALCAMSNGTTESRTITWEPLSDEQLAVLASREGGAFEAVGSVEGWGEPVSCTVEVAPAEPLSCADLPGALTEVGVAPELPASVDVTWSNGDVTSEAVSWDGPTSEQLASAGTVEIAGAVGSTGLTIKYTVSVSDSSIASLSNPSSITLEAGDALELPTLVDASMSNGTTEQRPVRWDALTDEQQGIIDGHTGGEVTVQGTVEGWDDPVSLTISVKPATPSCASTITCTTLDKVAPALPETIEVTWSNGETTQEAVLWHEPDADTYKAPGTFYIGGTVENTNLTVNCKVTVEASTIQSIGELEAVSFVEGSEPDLPSSIDVQLSNGESTRLPVAWQISDIDAHQAGETFELNGQVEGWDQPVTVTVTIEKAPEPEPVVAVTVDQPDPVTTDAGTEPVLPASTIVSWSDGTSTEEAIAWNAVDENSYHNGGSFSVEGTVGETGQTVSLDVEVAPARIESIEPVTAQTPAGIAPELPATVEVGWSNGDLTQEAVTWDLPDEGFSTEGTVTVDGSLDGDLDQNASIAVAATVQVDPAVVSDVVEPQTVSSSAGSSPKLPQTVTVIMSDGTQRDLPVSWEPVDEGTAHSGGSATVTGSVEGVDTPVKATVEVSKPTITKVKAPYVITTVGTKPDLPATVEVTWSNGDVTQESVTWEKILGGQYANAGTLQVNGTVAGKTISATVVIRQQGEVKGVNPVTIGIGAGIGALIAAAIALIAAKLHKRRKDKDHVTEDGPGTTPDGDTDGKAGSEGNASDGK